MPQRQTEDWQTDRETVRWTVSQSDRQTVRRTDKIISFNELQLLKEHQHKKKTKNIHYNGDTFAGTVRQTDAH